MESTPLPRRAWLAQGAALLAAPWAGPPAIAADHPALLAQLMALSREWTQRADLDQSVGAALLAGLLAGSTPGRLQALLGGARPDSPLAGTVVAAWYSGMLELHGTTRLLAYNDALLWQAMPFTKPPGRCGGATGYWADPPVTP